MIDKNTIEGNWHQIKGTLRAKWAHLTDNDIEEINGRSEVLIGKIQAAYGKTKEEAESMVREFENTKF